MTRRTREEALPVDETGGNATPETRSQAGGLESTSLSFPPYRGWKRGNDVQRVSGNTLETEGKRRKRTCDAGEGPSRRRPRPGNDAGATAPTGNAALAFEDARILDVGGLCNSCQRSESPTIHGTALASTTLPTADTHLPPEPSTTPDLDEALTKQGRARLSPIHERRDRARWLDRLREGVARVRPEASARRRAAIDHARLRGHATGQPEFGYRRVVGGELLVEDVREQRVLDLAAEMRADGHTLQAICDTLNATPKSATRRGTPWSVTTLRRRLVRIGCSHKGSAL